MTDASFPAQARRTYAAANAGTLRWMLDRPRRHGAFVDTKVNSITLADYGAQDGWRGPDVTYGWIQGRALEAIVTHAAFFEAEDPALAARLDEAGRTLFAALKRLVAADGHAYFAYDAAMSPVWPDAENRLRPQAAAGDLYTFSDAFVRKGLVAAAARYAPAEIDAELPGLLAVVRAIEDGRFVSDERQALGPDALARVRGDYGPRMILLGAAAMLKQCGCGEAAAFGRRFIEVILARHLTPSGALADVPGGDEANPGHAIEFAGFGLEFAGAEDPDLARTLTRILHASARLGLDGPGIVLKASLSTGRPTSAYRPWWPLPEAIRAAALAWHHTDDPDALALWKTCDGLFFRHYWRQEPPLAYQTLTDREPVDYVPATPDLDPGYHTGLSLLAAIRVADAAPAA